ncbi:MULTISPECIES: alpha/beta hydrolase [Streptomyces]|uniref:alpha/beta hydrolase n=1 Tax=Streptomyces TaxID=1883 RepID=UPI0002F116D3|nr:alpha/beta hydrolase [Streptomyces venezuelae]
MHHDATPTAARRPLIRARTLAVSTAALLVPQALAGSAAAAETPDAPTRRAEGVAAVTYDLGDQAYRLPGTGEPVEIAGTVHYPKDLGSTPRPLVVQLHGLHETCADRDAEAARDAAVRAGDWAAADAADRKLYSWPCAPGIRPLANDRGYDYLGEELARRGFVVVSVRANGINAASLWGDDNASARADLINKHLALWQRLSASGRGGLAGAFRDAATGKPRAVDFRHRVDLNRVGTMGHSRGGAGVTWQAADRHEAQWPAGVKVRAVLALAPAYNVMTEDMTAYEITGTPMSVIRGSCDGQVGPDALSFAADATARSTAGFHSAEIPGANHHYFNTRWSPESGEVAARDDASHDDAHPGRCTDPGGSTFHPQLTEAAQRGIGVAHAVAFFRRYLDRP